MDETTVVYPNHVGEYGFYYPRTWGNNVPMRVPSKFLHAHPDALERRFRTVQDYVPLLLKSDIGTTIVWRQNG